MRESNHALICCAHTSGWNLAVCISELQLAADLRWPHLTAENTAFSGRIIAHVWDKLSLPYLHFSIICIFVKLLFWLWSSSEAHRTEFSFWSSLFLKYLVQDKCFTFVYKWHSVGNRRLQGPVYFRQHYAHRKIQHDSVKTWLILDGEGGSLWISTKWLTLDIHRHPKVNSDAIGYITIVDRKLLLYKLGWSLGLHQHACVC